MYWNTEQKCRKITKIIGSYPLCHQSTFVAAFSFSIYCIATGNLDTTTWPLPLNLVMPFDTKPIWGWYLFWFIQFCMSLSYITCMVAVTTYFICCCYYIDAICNHFNYLVQSIEEYVDQNKENRKARMSKLANNKIKLQSHELIKLHMKILE